MIALVMAVLSLPVQAQAGGEYRVYTTAGQPVAATAWSQALQPYRAIIFGEYHDNAVLHQAEAELLESVFTTSPKLAVSLEMFERDVQPAVEQYLAGTIDEAAFLSQSRPWSNYQEAYRPLVEFAKQHALPVLAANIPRTVASQYAKQATLASVDSRLQQYLPQRHSAPDGVYRQKFMQYMEQQKEGMAIPASKLQDYYQAQCLKDDTMAESLGRFLMSHPDWRIIHYQGDFHSRGRLGVVQKLQEQQPGLAVGVIIPASVEQFEDLPIKAKQYRQEGDIVIFFCPSRNRLPQVQGIPGRPVNERLP